jgi:hypothetical protein
LVEQFAAPDQREAILGDLQEEFSATAAQTGIGPARLWFWRQVARTLVHLIAASVRQSSARFWLSVAGGFLIWWNVPMIIGEAVRRIHNRWQVYAYIDAYSFWLIYAVLVQDLFAPLLVGSLLAMSNKGRECVASVGLAATVFAWTGGWLLVAPNPSYRHLWVQELLRALLTGLSLFIGGWIIRNVRSAGVIQPSGA